MPHDTADSPELTDAIESLVQEFKQFHHDYLQAALARTGSETATWLAASRAALVRAESALEHLRAVFAKVMEGQGADAEFVNMLHRAVDSQEYNLRRDLEDLEEAEAAYRKAYGPKGLA